MYKHNYYYYYYIEIAGCHQTQAVMSDYQDLPVGQQKKEDPYHVSTDELLAIRNVCYY